MLHRSCRPFSSNATALITFNSSASSSALLLTCSSALRHQSTSFSAAAPENDESFSAGGGGDAGGVLNQTTEQRDHYLRHARRRKKVEDTTKKMLYEFHFLKKICQKRASTRQWLIRDDVLDMHPGLTEMSPSMQSAYMRVINSKEKGMLRQAIRDIVPVIIYRQTEKQQALLPRDNPQALIPAAEPGTLNAKKRELYERKDSVSAFQDERLVDGRAQNQLRWKIRLRLIKFQKQLAVQNASASRSILYSENDAAGYFVYRGAPMYAAMHRVFFELGKMVPHFVPKTMLDFGSGTGTTILVAKEVFDTDGLAMPVDKQARRHMNSNRSSVAWGLKELKTDLAKVSRTNAARRRARFVAVASLISNGEISLSDIPADLRREIVDAARVAASRAQERERVETLGRLKKFVKTAVNWDDDAEIERQLTAVDAAGASSSGTGEFSDATESADAFESDPAQAAAAADASNTHTGNTQHNNAAAGGGDNDGDNDDASVEDLLSGVAGTPRAPSDGSGIDAASKSGNGKTWWEQYVDDEFSSKEESIRRRLRPLQHIVAVEPSPGMIETAMNVLQDDVPNVSYERYLNPEDATQHDLVTCAYTLSEMASPEERARTVRALWRRTRGVLVLVEYANLPNFNLMMEARDTILAEKGAGLWDWQPTIIGPCPHEKRCPIRFSGLGVKRKSMRICKTESSYRPTFVEQWVHAYRRDDPRRKASMEPIVYMIFGRNEVVPERAERRLEEQRREEAAAVRRREQAQKDLFKAALKTKETMFENMSDEALQRPLRADGEDGQDGDGSAKNVPSSSTSLLAHPASVPESALAAQQHDVWTAAATGGAVVDENRPVTSSFAADSPSRVKPGVVEMVSSSSGSVNRFVYPESFPVATHRYNRAPFVGAAHQLQRIISPTELMVVRRDAHQTRKKYEKMLHKYWRIVLTLPRCRGKIIAHFCTSEGDLVRGRVYRRYYGRGAHKRSQAAPSKFSRWQYMSGWRYLKRARLLSAFPSDVPIYRIRKLPQIDFPNTLMHHASSVVEQTAMQHNAPLDPSVTAMDEAAAAANVEDVLTGGGRSKPAFSNAENDEAATLRSMTSSTMPPGGDDDDERSRQQQRGRAASVADRNRQQEQEEEEQDFDSVSDPARFFDKMSDERTNDLYKMMNRGAVEAAQIDSRSPVSGKQWVDAVKGAKRRMRTAIKTSRHELNQQDRRKRR